MLMWYSHSISWSRRQDDDTCIEIHANTAWGPDGDVLVIMVDSKGTGQISDEKLTKLVRKHFDLRPRALIEKLKLRRPIYRATAAYGHFGRTGPGFTWEKTDKARALARSA